jgi:SAM-dependent methyltransferase
VNKRELLRLEAIPAYQNKMFDSLEAARHCPTGDVVLVQDMQSGLVFNDCYDPDKLNYDETYQNEQGLSPVFRKHMDAVLEKMDRCFGGKQILEIGCGKGSFLDLLRQRGHDAIGVDPAYEGDAPYIHKHHFDDTLDIKAGAVILRHVLEHIPQPLEFLRSVAIANGGQGQIYIEVPCLDWIMRHKAWFDIFYEHVNYFRLSDFKRMFGKVSEAGHLFGEQYIYVIADLDSLRSPTEAGAPDAVAFPEDFFRELDALAGAASSARSRAVWGAAAKGVMFSHHLTKRGVSLDFAIDINPAKQGKYLAGSALPVLTPEQGLARLAPGDDVFVMNSNYIAEISAWGGSGLNYIPADRK